MRNLLCMFGAASVVVLSYSTSFACSCIPSSSSAVASLPYYSAVFSGRVIEIKKPENLAGSVEVRFTVAKSWKYVDAEEIVVTTNAWSASCGYPFKVGESYLVWGYVTGKDKTRIGTHLCSRTQALSTAGKDLQELGEGKKPSVKAEGAGG